MNSTTRIVLIPAILATAVLALAPVRAEGERRPQKPDEFLAAWVAGTARYDFFTKFHVDYPRSPHKRETEEFEVAFHCFHLRRKCSEDRAASLTKEFLKLYRVESTTADSRRRVLHALGRIRSQKALPLLCQVARTSRGDLQNAAVRSLGFHGAAPAEEHYMVFGGRFRSAVFPPAAAEAATQTLLLLLRELRDAKPEPTGTGPYRPGMITEERQRLQHLTGAVLRALKSHRGAKVAAAALETLVGSYRVRKVWLWKDLGEILVRNLEHVDPAQIVALLSDKRREVRMAAAYVLGWTASTKAVSPLIGMLEDQDDGVQDEANRALSRLSGEGPSLLDPGNKTAEEWIAALGQNGERLDTGKSLRHENPKPGVYRLGR